MLPDATLPMEPSSDRPLHSRTLPFVSLELLDGSENSDDDDTGLPSVPLMSLALATELLDVEAGDGVLGSSCCSIAKATVSAFES